jgi:hypothetical protein
MMLVNLVKSIRKNLEQGIRRVPESATNSLHDMLIPAGNQLHATKTANLHGVAEGDLVQSESVSRRHERERKREISLAHIRSLLKRNAKERELQDAVMKSRLLAVDSAVVDEVQIKDQNGRQKARMDIVVSETSRSRGEVFELKRGCAVLLARKGSNVQRLSAEIVRHYNQVKRYGCALQSQEVTEQIQSDTGLLMNNVDVTLVAGRQLDTPEQYSLLTELSNSMEQGFYIRIMTWDGFIRMLERMPFAY